jgi:NAD(P)-dependent dehydrogenase (short-subunit alcohol dehydrogenase family)
MQRQPRHAIVTGGASGLGRALAVRLASDGWHIAIADVDPSGGAETLRLVESAGGTGQFEPLDVTRVEDWARLRERLQANWPQLDLLVNNAGVAAIGDVGECPLESWQWVLSINLHGTIYGCHTFVDWLKANRGGAHLLNVSSFAAMAPSPSMGAYNASKAGVVALSETLYSELKPFGVSVTVLCPMYFATKILERARSYNASHRQVIEQGIERSTLTADSVADAAVDAIARKQLYAIPGWQARRYWWLRRLMPVRFLNGLFRKTAPPADASQLA